MQLHTLNTGFFKLDGGAMFGVVPKSLWKKINPPDEKNLCTWAMRCMLVEIDNKLILIDTGIGDKQSEKFFSYFEPHGEDSLTGSLNKLGLAPEDITDVVLTHLHFDHCGGAVNRNSDGSLSPAFKNATYWSHPDHWDWASDPNPREKASFLKENFDPIRAAGQLRFANDGDEIFPGFTVRCVYGHTEAMMIPHIEYKGRTVVYMADLMPSVGHIPMAYVMGYDIRPLVTLDERERFYREALEKDYVLFFEHDRVNECCNLKMTEKGVRAGDIFRLDDL